MVVQSGAVRINETPTKDVELAVLDPAGAQVRLQSELLARLLVLTGEPISEPVVGHGPFVMNMREEIQQAMRDYQSGRMGGASVSRPRKY